MKIVILEDSETERQQLVSLIVEMFGQEHWAFSITEFDKIPDSFSVFQETSLLFMDMCLGGDNGIRLGRELRRLYPHLRIIIISSFPHYLTEGYKTGACRYFMKPLDQALFRREMRELIQSPEFVQETGFQDPAISPAFIPFKSIEYIDYCRRKTWLHLSMGRALSTPYSLYDWEQRTVEAFFARISKSCLVNLRYVQEFLKSEGLLIMNGGDSLPVSRNFRKSLQQKLLMYTATSL